MIGAIGLLAIGCGKGTPWDADGDGISDATERNNRTALYHPFDESSFDEDPSRAVGRSYSGRLHGGINLPDQGAGYRHFRGSDPSDGDDWAALGLINCIEAVGRDWAEAGQATLVNVTDLSVQVGGRFHPHRSHQNGLDADVRYVRSDGLDAPLDLELQPDLLDVAATRRLMERFIDLCDIETIFADLDALDLPDEIDEVVHHDGHTNHFHVRLRGPDDEESPDA